MGAGGRRIASPRALAFAPASAAEPPLVVARGGACRTRPRGLAAARRDARGRRRDRRRGLHRALDGTRLARAGAEPAHRAARGARGRRGAERPQRRLPARLLELARHAACGARRRRRPSAGPRIECDRPSRARVLRRARRGRLAARGRPAQGRRVAGRGRGGRTVRRRGARARRRRGGGAAGRRRGPRAGRLAPLPPRRPLPRRRDRPARAPRPRLEARRARRRSRALRAHAGDAGRTRPAGDARRRRASPRARPGPQRVGHGLAPLAAADELRERRRPHRAGARPSRGDRLDRRRGDRRRPHVPPLLPHDAGRSRADGQRLGAARARGPSRHPPPRRPPGAGPRPRRTAPAPPRSRRGAARSALERADRRLRRPPAVLRHRARDADPLRGGLLGQRRRPELARRPDPRLARPRVGGRVDGAAARRAAAAQAPAGAVPLRRRTARPLGDARRRGSARGGRTPSRAARAAAGLPRLLRLPIGTR